MACKLMPCAVLAALALTGCASTKDRADAAVGGSTQAYGQAAGGAATISDAGGAQRAAPSPVVYFAYDSDEIDAQGAATIADWARVMGGGSVPGVRLEGHADERGTPEYNTALGERRAVAVRNALVAQGVGADQLTTLSYGEEKPLASGHDESSWAQNRRVEFVR